MSDWYYVEGKERVGPVDQETIISLMKKDLLNQESFLWKKGFEDWQKLEDIPELMILIEDEEEEVAVENVASIDEIPPFVTEGLDWDNIDKNSPVFMVKIGMDRGTNEVEYGPYSLNQLKRASDENRINSKTYVFSAGMANWMLLGDIPVYEEVFESLPPAIDDDDRRKHTRKPFVARLFFHDNEDVFDGICRDVSVGGLQILISGFPAKVGDDVTLNVHPDNTEHSFVAKGRIVRVLDGSQGFSLRFHSLSDSATKAILNYIEVT